MSESLHIFEVKKKEKNTLVEIWLWTKKLKAADIYVAIIFRFFSWLWDAAAAHFEDDEEEKKRLKTDV